MYVASPFSGSEAFERIHHFLQKDRGCEEEALLPSSHSHVDSDCIEHLFKVASGLDSLVLGETEILGQLKDAYQCAVGAKSTGKALNKLFQKAFHVAKHIRSNTGDSTGQHLRGFGGRRAGREDFRWPGRKAGDGDWCG